MNLRSFSDYHCLLALDPDEWPGDWEGLLKHFPLAASKQKICFELQREVTLIILGPDVQAMQEIIEFLDVVFTQWPDPIGGFVFLDKSGQMFRTNWDLVECWDWQHVLQRAKLEQCFLQCFSQSGAVVEFRQIAGEMQIQPLDYEHPSGIEGSRVELDGVKLKDVNLFMREVGGAFDYLQSLTASAERKGKAASFAKAFGRLSPNVM